MPFDEPQGLSLVGALADVYKLLRRAQACEVTDDYDEREEALEGAIDLLYDELRAAKAARVDAGYTNYDRSL